MVISFSNIGSGATYALNALQQVSQASEQSIEQLSTGNAIVDPSINPSALYLGTILQANTSAMQAALVNANQASNLIDAASGGVEQVVSVLQSMQSLAVQANSGGLTNSNLANLNTQFQTMLAEINQIAASTNFNGLNLIDGTLSNNTPVGSSAISNASQAQGTITFNTAFAPAGSNENHVFINGAAFPLTAQANIGTLADTTGDQANISIATNTNNTPAKQAQALYNAIQYALSYNGSNTTVQSVKQALAQSSYSYTAGNSYITVTSNVAGTIGNGTASGKAFSAGADTATASDFLVNGGNASNVTVSTAVGIGYSAAGYTPNNVAVNGALNGGSFPTSGTAYNGTATTIAQGNIEDSILTPLTTTNEATTGIDASQISNNSSFVGNIQGFTASYVSANVATINLAVGGITYTASNVNTNFAANTKVTLSSSTGGSLILNFAGTGISVASQTDANTIANRLNTAFSGVTFYQNRNVSTYSGVGLVTNASGSTIGNLVGSSFQLINSNFASQNIQGITVTAPPTGGTVPVITFNINGDTYTSSYDATGKASTLPSSITTGSYGFVDQNNPNNVLILNYNNSTPLDISTTANATAVQTALSKAFGMNTNAGQTVIQVGASSKQTLPLSIQGVKTSQILFDSNGNPATLNISTLSGAQSAVTILNNAISSVNGELTNLGAMQSQFNYASNNLNNMIQAFSSASSLYLNTDIPTVSSNFAQQQAQMQATISVLAKANAMSQELLKLLA